MVYMFDRVSFFNGDILLWNVDNVIIMERMFYEVKEFNKLIFKLVSFKVINLDYMFYGVLKFNDKNIVEWNILLVVIINVMFRDVIEFN